MNRILTVLVKWADGRAERRARDAQMQDEIARLLEENLALARSINARLRVMNDETEERLRDLGLAEQARKQWN